MKIALTRRTEETHHLNYSVLMKKTCQIKTANQFQFSPLDSAHTQNTDSLEIKLIPRKLLKTTSTQEEYHPSIPKKLRHPSKNEKRVKIATFRLKT